jgi:endonuclease/exonuclease/phosphatase family metal-dependent hydrolase
MSININGANNQLPVTPTQAPKTVAPTAKPAATMAADSYQSTDVKVITFNTAIGNRAIKTDQKDFTKLPFYQAVINGEPNAPILCLQEVGNAQRDLVKQLAANGNFHVYSQKVGLAGRQNNMVLIPKRYQVVEHENNKYDLNHLKAAAGKVWGWVKSFGKEKINWGQTVEPRGYQQVLLKDTLTNKQLTVFNTHMSYYDEIKVAHGKELFKAAEAAKKNGPVIVAGDLNTRTADTDPGDPFNAQVRGMFGDLKDMGPQGKPPSKTNIDWVLADGFESVSSKWYTGDSISLPGSPDALTVSDHYAEEDVLRYK